MKNTKKMMSLLCLYAMVCGATSFAKEKPQSPISTAAIRSLDWASDETNFPNLQVKADCFQRDAKHYVWQTTVRSTSESALEVKGKGKAVGVDAMASADLGSTEVKSCDKPLELKLEARAPGAREHYELEYKNGSVTAHQKQPRNWGGFAMALTMVGTGAMAMQAANQAQFGATEAIRNAAQLRADQLNALQGALAQAGSAQAGDADQADGSDGSDQSGDSSDPQ